MIDPTPMLKEIEFLNERIEKLQEENERLRKVVGTSKEVVNIFRFIGHSGLYESQKGWLLKLRLEIEELEGMCVI